jgi:hypothetical protein
VKAKRNCWRPSPGANAGERTGPGTASATWASTRSSAQVYYWLGLLSDTEGDAQQA